LETSVSIRVIRGQIFLFVFIKSFLWVLNRAFGTIFYRKLFVATLQVVIKTGFLKYMISDIKVAENSCFGG